STLSITAQIYNNSMRTSLSTSRRSGPPFNNMSELITLMEKDEWIHVQEENGFSLDHFCAPEECERLKHLGHRMESANESEWKRLLSSHPSPDCLHLQIRPCL
ncbi:hypothetical protein PFISCL1PPCAC_10991, partial [Pristionchus fissidentatus]